MGSVPVPTEQPASPHIRPYSAVALVIELALYWLFVSIAVPLWNKLCPPLALWGSHLAQLAVAVFLLRCSRLKPRYAARPGELRRTLQLTAFVALPAIVVPLIEKTWLLKNYLLSHPDKFNAAIAKVRGASAWDWFVNMTYYLVLIALAEELAYRGYFHTRLREPFTGELRLGRLRVSRAAIASGAVFSLMHLVNYVSPGSFPAAGVFVLRHGWIWLYGVAAAWLYDCTGSLLGPLLVHAAVNAVNNLGPIATVLYLGRLWGR